MKRARALVAALLASSVAAAALAADEATPATEKKQRALSTQLQTRTGDFDEMRELRILRVLVPYGRTLFFHDKGASYGITAQAAGGTDAQIYFSQLAAPADPEAAGESEAHDEEGETRQLLRGALEQIRAQVHPQTWQAFWKVVVEGKTPEEVGEELAMRPGTVRVAKSRVLSRLRAELGELL